MKPVKAWAIVDKDDRLVYPVSRAFGGTTSERAEIWKNKKDAIGASFNDEKVVRVIIKEE